MKRKLLRYLGVCDGLMVFYCPRCKSRKLQKRGIQSRSQRYSCNECDLNFSDLTGTIFMNKKIPMGEMLYILHNIDFESVKRLF